MKKKKKGFVFKQDRTRIFKDERVDVYREKKKYKDPSRCPDCGALFLKGRWTWEDTDLETEKVLCPACKRIEENYPAGFVTLSGPFFEEHKQEILHMVRNLEKTESSEHPLERVMEIEEENQHTLVTTTGFHMARRLADALKHSYQGDLEISYDAENYIRASWSR